MTNYSQLNISQRETICILLNKGKNFTEIGNSIDKDRTTVSKEIRRNRYIKSNFYEPFDIKGINKAIEDVNTKETGEIPMHIRNAPVEDMQNFGYSNGYKYPHDYPGHVVDQQYLPDEMLGTKYYVPDENCVQ